MLLPLQGANPNIHRPRALPWAGCLLAFQAVTSQKLYRTPIVIIPVRVYDNSVSRGGNKIRLGRQNTIVHPAPIILQCFLLMVMVGDTFGIQGAFVAGSNHAFSRMFSPKYNNDSLSLSYFLHKFAVIRQPKGGESRHRFPLHHCALRS